MSSRAIARLRPIVPVAITPATRAVYRQLTGRHSRAIVEARLMRDVTRSPARTYNEKMRFKMAFDRRPILTQLADKVAVRTYVADRIGAGFLTDAYAVATDPSEIDWAALPDEFVVKVNHASGGMVIVWNGADDAPLPRRAADVAWDRLQVRPGRYDHAQLEALLRHWLGQDFSWFPGKGMIEWAYHDVPRKVLVEEFLSDGGELPRDLKFTMVDGEVIWIQVDSDRFGAHHKDLMTPNWERLPVTYNRVPMSAEPPPKPRHLAELVAAATELGKGLDFIRADFYELEDRLVFGELTHYPACGRGHVDPPHFDLEWGRRWTCDYSLPSTEEGRDHAC